MVHRSNSQVFILQHKIRIEDRHCIEAIIAGRAARQSVDLADFRQCVVVETDKFHPFLDVSHRHVILDAVQAGDAKAGLMVRDERERVVFPLVQTELETHRISEQAGAKHFHRHNRTLHALHKRRFPLRKLAVKDENKHAATANPFFAVVKSSTHTKNRVLDVREAAPLHT